MFDKNLLKLSGMHAVLGALAVLALLQAACVVGWAVGLSQTVCALWEGLGMDAALPSLILFAACFIALQLVRFAQETMLDRYSLKRARELRDGIMARTFDSESLLSFHIGAARVAALANDGVDEVQTYLRIIPPKIIGMVAISMPLLVFEFAIDWLSGIILAVMFPVIMFFMILIGRQARENSERQYVRYTRLTNQFMDTLRGLPVIKAFGAQRTESDRVYSNSESVRTATVRTLRTATLSSAVLDLCATFGVAAVAIMLAFRLMDGSLALYTGLLALIVAPEYFAPIRSFASDYHASLDGKNSLAEVLDVIAPASLPTDVPDSARAKVDSRQYAVEDQETRTSGEDTRESAAIGSSDVIVPYAKFDNAAYRYETGAVGIEGISLQASGCERIGVIGASGAGKSTLAGLFAGFLTPTAGSIEVSDGWGRMVRYVPQHPYIFKMTLDENIRFYRPSATRDEVEAAVRMVGLDDLVKALPNGLDTFVGEGERGLSGGEAHRVALARILVDRDARVLVFDEPTAHLDIETERDLKGPMLAAMEGKLVLFATHRRHWIADMDRVIELEGGRMVGGRMCPDAVSASVAKSSPKDGGNPRGESPDYPTSEASEMRSEVVE